ncbi:MAG: hypothetical protein NXY57DRAFT_1024792 [Lentinula lateritia]|nr:MAG: hypothetical protein NXY57DRAFT_1024792 [Lentinula lateritia]
MLKAWRNRHVSILFIRVLNLSSWSLVWFYADINLPVQSQKNKEEQLGTEIEGGILTHKSEFGMMIIPELYIYMAHEFKDVR